jgi:DNA-binding transcriptional MocR family regulator
MTALKQYRINAHSAAELVREVETAVADGAFAPGEQLPSVRTLAAEIGLSPATVSAALAELRRRGVVISEPRRGTRIGEGPPIGLSRAPLPVPPGARDLSLGNPDPALLPDLERALARLRLPTRLYGEEQVIPGLAELAAEQLRADGLAGEELCIVSGALDGIERVLRAQLRPGDRVAVENPGYAALYDLLRAQGLLLEPVAVDDRGMLPGALDAAIERGASAAIITPRGQNPTGAALDAERALALRAVLARAPATLVIEDDHLGAIAGCALHTTIAAAQPRWAATRSVSKAMGPDLRLAVLSGDAHTIARVRGAQQCGPGWVSHVLQALVLALWSDPDVNAEVEQASATYVRRRTHLRECLSQRGIAASGCSGLNVWAHVEDEAGALGALLQRGWVVAPGAPYRLAGSAAAIRITTATLEQHEAERLSDDLVQVLDPRRGTRSG